MRTIKFRAWDSKNKKFALKDFNIIGECTIFDLPNQYSLEETCDLEITQFTGLKDKSGKDIYEGDIVKTERWLMPNSVGEVKYDDNMATFIVSYSKDGFIYLSDFPLSLEVRGNVFENPELLNR